MATGQDPYWLTRSLRTVLFLAVVLTAAGIYAFFRTPIAVFPETNFPRVVIGVDNGVMPVEQMQVTITKPIEDAVNSVPGLVTVRSTTSRGSAEVSLFFDWNVDMFRTLQLDRRRALSKSLSPSFHRHRQASPPIASPSRPFPSSATPLPSTRRFQQSPRPALGAGHLHAQAAAQSRATASAPSYDPGRARCRSSTSSPTSPGCRPRA